MFALRWHLGKITQPSPDQRSLSFESRHRYAVYLVNFALSLLVLDPMSCIDVRSDDSQYISNRKTKKDEKDIKLTCTMPEISISPTSNPFAPYPSESGIDAAWEEMGRMVNSSSRTRQFGLSPIEQ